jgi:broad specificity phosphatase PhoE
MMQLHLIRHGHHALLGHVLCGRMPAVGLDAQGRQQMLEIAELIGHRAPLAVQSSPQRRAVQSAEIIAANFGLPVEIVSAFDEIDLGFWTGAQFKDLASDSRWQAWNERRGSARPPGGESMSALQARVVRHIEQLESQHSDVTIVIVSHAEPIRAALMHYLNVPLDQFHTLDIDPASISTIQFGGRPIVSCVNNKVMA